LTGEKNRPWAYINLGKMPNDAEDNSPDLSDHLSDNEEDSEFPNKDGDKMNDIKKKYDPKDPQRPRRKKARRACFACQRAHLTCGTFPTR
jgi:hypothetical protein